MFGKTAGQLGQVLDPTRGTCTLGDEASLQMNKTASRVIERSSQHNAEDEPELKRHHLEDEIDCDIHHRRQVPEVSVQVSVQHSR